MSRATSSAAAAQRVAIELERSRVSGADSGLKHVSFGSLPPADRFRTTGRFRKEVAFDSGELSLEPGLRTRESTSDLRSWGVCSLTKEGRQSAFTWRLQTLHRRRGVRCLASISGWCRATALADTGHPRTTGLAESSSSRHARYASRAMQGSGRMKEIAWA